MFYTMHKRKRGGNLVSSEQNVENKKIVKKLNNQRAQPQDAF